MAAEAEAAPEDTALQKAAAKAAKAVAEAPCLGLGCG